MKPLIILVVDDHPLFRRSLLALLAQDARFAAPLEAFDIGEALQRLHDQVPDLILLDNHLPGMRSIDAIASLKAACPGVRVLMLTVSEEAADLAAVFKAGADGYLLKTVASDDLCDSIVKLLAGESVVSPEMMTKLVRALQAPAGAAPMSQGAPPDGLGVLSSREREILARIAQGASNKQIARQLDMAETTVKIHVQHILRKLNLTSRVQAVVYAVARGMA